MQDRQESPVQDVLSNELLIISEVKDLDLRRRARAVREHCKSRLEFIHSKGLFRFYNGHGITHSERVLRVMSKILEAGEPNRRLTEYELFLLYLSAYCHDLGMLILPGEDFNDPKTCNRVRNRHYERVSAYLDANWQEMKLLNQAEAQVLANICQAHGLQTCLECCAETNSVILSDSQVGLRRCETVRERLLAAILRLADAFDADERRLPYQACRQSDDIPFEQHIEYYKCEMVQSVDVDPVTRAITIHLLLQYENPLDPHTGCPIEVVDDVQKAIKDEFASVAEILSTNLCRFQQPEFPRTSASPLKRRPDSICGRSGLERQGNIAWRFFKGLPIQGVPPKKT